MHGYEEMKNKIIRREPIFGLRVEKDFANFMVEFKKEMDRRLKIDRPAKQAYTTNATGADKGGDNYL